VSYHGAQTPTIQTLRRSLEISRALECGESTPYRARKRYADRGIAAVHRRNPNRDYERKLNGDEARLIKLACSANQALDNRTPAEEVAND
jgi:hypothetical protein